MGPALPTPPGPLLLHQPWLLTPTWLHCPAPSFLAAVFSPKDEQSHLPPTCPSSSRLSSCECFACQVGCGDYRQVGQGVRIPFLPAHVGMANLQPPKQSCVAGEARRQAFRIRVLRFLSSRPTLAIFPFYHPLLSHAHLKPELCSCLRPNPNTITLTLPSLDLTLGVMISLPPASGGTPRAKGQDGHQGRGKHVLQGGRP